MKSARCPTLFDAPVHKSAKLQLTDSEKSERSSKNAVQNHAVLAWFTANREGTAYKCWLGLIESGRLPATTLLGSVRRACCDLGLEDSGKREMGGYGIKNIVYRLKEVA